MTTKEKTFILDQIKHNYQEIMASKDLHSDRKIKMLSYLMSQLEDLFNIPMLTKFLSKDQNESQELKLYSMISNSKNF